MSEESGKEVEVFYEGEVITRKEALDKGLVRYFTGKPCQFNHIEERHTKSGSCLECSRQRSRRISAKSGKVNGVDYGYKKGSIPHNKGVSKTEAGNIYTSLGGYGDYIVTKYVDHAEVHIKFLNTGWEDVVWASAARNGQVKDYLVPEIFGVGYNSMGKLRGRNHDELLKIARCKWEDMLERCYCSVKWEQNPTYQKCTVDEEWHDFANFYEWFSKVCDSEEKFNFHLDKDLLVKGNNVYSKDTCCLVPRKLNNILVSKVSNKHTDLPVGVHYHKRNGRYQTYCNDFEGKRHSLGFYDTPEEAFEVYKAFKEPVIREAATFYKDCIDKRLFDVLIDYHITDDYFNKEIL